MTLLLAVVAGTLIGLSLGALGGARPGLDDPIISMRDGLLCDCPRAIKVLITATAVGLLTGFLGVGGGFLVVPALMLAPALPMEYAAGTSLVVITLTSASALAVIASVGVTPDWGSPPSQRPRPSAASSERDWLTGPTPPNSP